jgi:hypothetical protein
MNTFRPFGVIFTPKPGRPGSICLQCARPVGDQMHFHQWKRREVITFRQRGRPIRRRKSPLARSCFLTCSGRGIRCQHLTHI